MALLQLRRKKKHRSKWVPTIRLLIVAAVLFAGWKAYGPAKQKYRSWKQQRALAQAKMFIEKNDPANAQVALELALSTVPDSPDAWRLAADMLEQVGAPQAMRLRRRVVDMVPDSVEDRAKLIISCLKFKDMNAARDAISAMTVEQGSQLPALRAQLSYALMSDNAPIADALFDRIKALSPNDSEMTISHNVLLLRSPRAERVDKAMKELEALAENPKYRLRIRRELLNEAILRKNFDRVHAMTAQIMADPEVTLSDRLNAANIELLVDKKPFEEVFAKVSTEVPADAKNAAVFVQWLLVQGKAVVAEKWLAPQPEALKNAPELLTLTADIYASLKNWTALASLLERGAWGPIKPETVKLAMSARLLSAADSATLRAQIWDETIRSANSSLSAMRVLQRLASTWGWEVETERTLWAAVKSYPDQTWIHQLLFNVYRARKDAEGMRNVMSLQRDADPTVRRYQHDWALLSLLTEPTQTWNPPKEAMKKLYFESPEVANYAMSYAFALAQSGNGVDAVKLVDAMPELEKQIPSRAPYLAYVYGVARRKADLEKVLQKADSLDFLRQEKQLFTQASELVGRAANPLPAAKSANEKTSKGTEPRA